jgi:hypothetical protein
MDCFDLKCGERSGCYSPVTIACNCGIPVVFLCDGCISTHVHKAGNHRLINLNQVQQLMSSSSFLGYIEQSYLKYLRIKSDILSYIQNLKDFKDKVITFKIEIMDLIENKFISKLEKIDSIIESTYIKLDELNQETDNQALRRYEEKGIEGVISNYIYNMNINIYDIKEALNDIIVLETRDSHMITSTSKTSYVLPIQIQELQELIKAQTSRSDELENRLIQLQDETSVLESSTIYHSSFRRHFMDSKFEEVKLPQPKSTTKISRNTIYTIKNNTNQLIKYDSDTDTITRYILTDLPNELRFAATTMLPDGTILIAGGNVISQIVNYSSSETFRVTFENNIPSLTKVGDLHFPRSGAKMVVHGDYVYIFGGLYDYATYSSMAERMKIGEWIWDSLPNMRESRAGFGVYLSESRIYLIGGRNNTSIEYYDLEANNFYLLANIQVPKYGIVCGVVDDLIFAVGKRLLNVLNKDFQFIQPPEYITNTLTWCTSDVIVQGKNLIYIDNNYSNVYSFESTSMKIITKKSF